MLKDAGEATEEEVEEMLPEEDADGDNEGVALEAGMESEDKTIGSDKEVRKKPDVDIDIDNVVDDTARKALTEIQTALSRLDEHTYNRNGTAVSLELDRETGKRIDIKS